MQWHLPPVGGMHFRANIFVFCPDIEILDHHSSGCPEKSTAFSYEHSIEYDSRRDSLVTSPQDVEVRNWSCYSYFAAAKDIESASSDCI